MKTLCMDSSHKHLVIVLLEDGKIKASSEHDCWKRQSETLFPQLMKCCEEAGWNSEDIDEVVITDGPGSYTGVRIAMSVAKVFCTTMNKPLFCISSLQLYAGTNENAFVILDARSNRAYCAHVQKGNIIGDEMILTTEAIKEQIKDKDYALFGDCELIDQVSEPLHLAQHFCELYPLARSIENIHTLVPRYLKDTDAYKRKSS